MLSYKREESGAGPGLQIQVRHGAGARWPGQVQAAGQAAWCRPAWDQAGDGALVSRPQCHALRIHVEEQEDGEERPDLDQHGLTISPVGCAASKLQRATLV